MKAIQAKIERLGYSVVHNASQSDGELKVTSVSAKRNGRVVSTAKSLTQLHNAIK
jgi:hypothetical protein